MVSQLNDLLDHLLEEKSIHMIHMEIWDLKNPSVRRFSKFLGWWLVVHDS